MKKFLLNIIFFFLIAAATGEVIVRVTHITSDIPKRTIDKSGIQKYYPNQVGFWKGGDHNWVINRLGWPGKLPSSFNNLIIIIGDSYIENFMNPNECHQSVYLKEKLPNFNFLETARSGVSLIEAMEISKQNDSLKPEQTLIYVNDYDFYESLVDVRPMNDVTQLDLKNYKIRKGKLKAPGLKKILYNWKLLYYFYKRFPLNQQIKNDNKPTPTVSINSIELEYKDEVFALINYIVKNYNIDDKSLIFHPNSNQLIINKCKQSGFKVIELDSSRDSNWTFEYDKHWTCYGHMRAAIQVSQQLLNTLSITN
jgi:hypothetical protein